MWIYPQPAQAKISTKIEVSGYSQKDINQVVEQPKPQINEVQLKPVDVGTSVPRVYGKKQKSKTNHSHTKQSSPVQKTTAFSVQHYSKEEVENLIRKYSDLYGISSDTPRCIAFHESGYNQYSANKRSSASGVFQYLSG
jgi:hypothetical protein